MITIKNLTKNYDKKTIFNAMNWTFPNQGLICLLGPSGCGKSTLLNMIAGFDRKYSGEIIVGGTSLTPLNTVELCAYRRDTIGFVFQNYHLLTGYTVLENLLLATTLNNEDSVKNHETAKSLLLRLGIYDKINEKSENLSGGQKQRVAIARALMKNPPIILADEPTGALDRKSANEIMELLKEIATDHLVLVITHDKKVCTFADRIISIEEKQISGKQEENKISHKLIKKQTNTTTFPIFYYACKNFKVHLLRYLIIGLAISLGVLAFILSLSSKNSIQKSVLDFKEKNIAYNNGYIKTDDKYEQVLSLLKKEHRIENVYEQYVIENISLSINGKKEIITEKYPMPKATETMSYNSMPQDQKNQIALSPSLAKKFNSDISKLIGKKVALEYNQKTYNLTVSGIFNAAYDDFFVSLDIEKNFYKAAKENPYSISYDVQHFEDIVSIHQMLKDKGIHAQTAVDEVKALQKNFNNISQLFFVVSILILIIGLFISIILLIKLQNSRYREVGLLAALGYQERQIRAMILGEALLLSGFSAIINGLTIVCLIGLTSTFHFIITLPQIIVSIFGTALIVIIISIFTSYQLIQTEPAVALRK